MEREEFSNVWEAIEDDPAMVAAMTARSLLMMEIDDTVKGWQVSQTEAAKRLGVTQPRLNDLMRGKINKFSLDALMKLAADAGLKVSLQVEKVAA
ncbi:MAG: XRE family transcriptional regulator [Rhizobiaceae bacterium]